MMISRGNISLLQAANKKIAVVCFLDPDKDIEK
jgi:hypothetical protein